MIVATPAADLRLLRLFAIDPSLKMNLITPRIVGKVHYRTCVSLGTDPLEALAPAMSANCMVAARDKLGFVADFDEVDEVVCFLKPGESTTVFAMKFLTLESYYSYYPLTRSFTVRLQ